MKREEKKFFEKQFKIKFHSQLVLPPCHLHHHSLPLSAALCLSESAEQTAVEEFVNAVPDDWVRLRPLRPVSFAVIRPHPLHSPPLLPFPCPVFASLVAEKTFLFFCFLKERKTVH
jgi:hypothetical protein